MKTLFLMLLLSLVALPGKAQKGLFETLTTTYSEKNGFSASRITSDMFDLYLKKKNIGEASPVYDALKTLDDILVVSQTNFLNTGVASPQTKEQDNRVEEIHQEMLKYYENNHYTLLKTEKQMGEEVKVFLKKNRDKIEALALVTNSDRATNLVELQGKDIDLTAVSELNKVLNLRGLENLYKINSQTPYGFYVPAPEVPSEEQIREMVEKQREVIEKQHYLSGQQRQEIEVRARAMADKQREMAEKYREMAEKYHRQPIFLSTPGDSTIFYIDGRKVEAGQVKTIPPENIESVEVKKGEGEKGKTTIRITTRK